MSFPTTIYGSIAEARKTYAAQGEIPLGTRLVVPDGRVFRYTQAGATALKPFKLVKTADAGPWTTMSASNLAIGCYGRVTSYLAGATQIKFYYGATGSAAANYFKDGWLVVQCTDTANVQLCRLGAHSALASCTALNSANVINIPEGLSLALSTETELGVRLIANPYKAVIVTTQDAKGIPLGCPIVGVTEAYYFWCQTWGPCPVLQDTGVQDLSAQVAGLIMCLATGGTGAVCGPSTQATNNVYDTDSGRAMYCGPVGNLIQTGFGATYYAVVDLRLAA